MRARIKAMQLSWQRFYGSERMLKVRAVVWRAAKVFRLLFLPDFKALWRLVRNDYPNNFKAGDMTKHTLAAMQRATTPGRRVHIAFARMKPLVVLAWYFLALVFAILAIWLGYSFFIVTHWSEKLNCFMGFCAALTFSGSGFYGTWHYVEKVYRYRDSIENYILDSPGQKTLSQQQE